MSNQSHESYMQRCFHLAKLGIGNAAPNPLVGSVIVYNDRIIGEGYHEKYGETHAEVNAIRSVRDKTLLKDSTIYVNLEPCAHFGKTPPCANLIIESEIPRVVIGCVDSFSEVAGKGIERLRQTGIEVIVGVMEKEALFLNRRFFTFHTEQRPYVILKWAQSADQFIDIKRQDGEKGIHWITQPETQVLVHQWRTEEASILVGRQTIENDNPHLNCRAYDGNSPLRIVIDPELKLSVNNYHIGQNESTIILNLKRSEAKGSVTYCQLHDLSAKSILKQLYRLNIQSVIIEGGKTTLNHFVDADLWDEVRILTGINLLGQGETAPRIQTGRIENTWFGKDQLTIIKR